MKNLLPMAFMMMVLSFAQAEEKPILVDAKWLKEHLNDPNLVVLQVNFLRLDYESEHVAGARHLWPEYVAPNSPEGSFNTPDPAKATEYLQSLGINSDSHIVLTYRTINEVSLTARMFLTLEHLGLKGQVSLLDGGLDSWKKAGNPVTKELPSPPKRGNFKVKPQALIVNKDYVINTLQSDKGFVVDARMKRYYDGEPTGNPRDGHIAGAKNIPYLDLLDQQSSMFKPLDSLQRYFAPVAPKNKELVAYCFIGQTASVVYMAGRMLGYEMKLYDGSMQEWSRIESLPMEKSQK